MYHQSQFYSSAVLTVLIISFNCVNCDPLPGSKINSSSDLSDDVNLRFPETPDVKIDQSEENVKDNLIQSGESDGKYANSENFENGSSQKDSLQNEGPQQQLSKFYRISIRSANPSSSSSDSIIFPSATASSNIEEPYNRFPASGFSDRYNRHRPNIPTPQVSIPFNFGLGLPVRPPPSLQQATPAYSNYYNRRSQGQGQNQRPISSNNDFLTREQDDLLYQSLVELFRGLFTRQGQYSRSVEQQPQPSYNRITFTKSPTPTLTPVKEEEEKDNEKKEEKDGVNYQSLYSGPKLDKSPCPNGMHRTHSGSCHEKSPRKLLRSSG